MADPIADTLDSPAPDPPEPLQTFPPDGMPPPPDATGAEPDVDLWVVDRVAVDRFGDLEVERAAAACAAAAAAACSAAMRAFSAACHAAWASTAAFSGAATPA